MKVLITGVTGQVGFDTAKQMLKRNHSVVGTGLRDKFDEIPGIKYISMDITDREKVIYNISEERPDVIIHCAAWTNVDEAEDDDNKSKVYNLNVCATATIAEVCKKLDITLIYISTDYVFGGFGDKPWEPEEKVENTLNYYGMTKAEAERQVMSLLDKYYIVRIAWAYGIAGKNFVKTMINLSSKVDKVKVVCDQIGTPTYTVDLAAMLADMAETDKYGIYHVTNEGGYISWYDFTCEIYRQAGIKTVVEPVTTKEYGLSKAVRPYNSRLDTSKLCKEGFLPLPDWKDALDRFLKEFLK